MKTEFFKERYDFELTLRDQLSERTSTPLTVITALGGALVFFIHNYPFSGDCWTALFVLLLAAFGLALFVGIYSIFEANIAGQYKAVADGSELMDWYDNLLKHYEKDEAKANAEFERGICERYHDATKVNAQVNARKVKALARANWALACAAALALLTSVPYLVSLASKEDKPMKIEIVKGAL
jgi:hypothetical protein